MASSLELIRQIAAESADAFEKPAGPMSASEEFVKAATVKGLRLLVSDIDLLRDLSKSPRIETWLANNRDRNCRDGGSISTLVELLELLRSMA